jgi:hypothetical protein
LPGLASKRDLPDLCHLSTWDYRREPPGTQHIPNIEYDSYLPKFMLEFGPQGNSVKKLWEFPEEIRSLGGIKARLSLNVVPTYAH